MRKGRGKGTGLVLERLIATEFIVDTLVIFLL